MATASTVVRRALLYVPASSPKFLQKSHSITADNITYDLEDSVTPTKKPEARANLREFLKGNRPPNVGEVAARINSVDTGYALDDLTAVLAAPNLDAIVIPKVNSASDLQFVTDAIRHLSPARHGNAGTTSTSGDGEEDGGAKRGPLKLIALIESAKALQNLSSICSASPYLSGLIFAAEDFALDLSLTRTPSLREFLYARSAITTAARAANLPGGAIDLVCTSFRGEEGLAALRDECEDGKKLGFTGKQCIHPSQVAVAQEVYSPSEKEVEWAIRCVIADEKADAQGRGAWTLDGKMIDVPVVGKAKGIVVKARACGFDVEGLREKWKDQEPE